MEQKVYKVLVRIICPPSPFLHEDLPNNGQFEVLCAGFNEKDAERRVLRAFTFENGVDEYLGYSLIRVLQVSEIDGKEYKEEE